jgi:hypothetical protein
MSEDKEKEELIEEIRKRIRYLVSTNEISDSEKVTIVRNALNLIENGEKEKVEVVQ